MVKVKKGTINKGFITVLLTVLGMVACASGLPAVADQLPGASSPLLTSATTTGQPTDFKVIPALIPMQDGGKLAADIILPEEGKKYPAILISTPYGKSRDVATGALAFMETMRGKNPYSPFPETRDYAVVYVDQRGRYESTSNPRRSGVNPGGKDGYDCVEWIAVQPWCNGKVAMFGASALGSVQYITAVEKPPHLVCIVPFVADPVGDYEKSHPGGVLRKEWNDRVGQTGFAAGQQRNAQNPLDGSAYEGDTGGGINSWEEARNLLRDIEVPILACGGWYDINEITSLFNDLRQKGNPKVKDLHRLIMTPWPHQGVKSGSRPNSEAEAAFVREQVRLFYEYWLLGKANGARTAPRVIYYQLGEETWKTSGSWPPSGMTELKLFLENPSALTFKETGVNALPRQFQSNPANPVPSVGGNLFNPTYNPGIADQAQNVEKHPDVLIYSTEPLSQDLVVDGDVRLKLHISSNAEDTDVVFRLCDVFQDGRSMLLREGVLRLSLRDTFREYRWLKPGEIYEVNIKGDPIANTFLKGHRIRLIISSSSYPHYELNTNTVNKRGAAVTATNLLYADSKYTSVLSLMTRTN